MSAFEQFGRQIQGAHTCRYKMYVLYRIWIVAMASIIFGVAGVWLWTALIGRWLLLTPDWCLMVLYTLVILLLTQKTGLWGLQSNIRGVRYCKTKSRPFSTPSECACSCGLTHSIKFAYTHHMYMYTTEWHFYARVLFTFVRVKCWLHKIVLHRFIKRFVRWPCILYFLEFFLPLKCSRTCHLALAERNKPRPWIVPAPYVRVIILIGVAQCSIAR